MPEMPGQFNVKFVVPRASADEFTFAVVTGTVGQIELRNEKAFRDALARAVTKWIAETKAGKREWNRSRCDFNIGDLALVDFDDADGSLYSYLNAEGILEMEVTVSARDSQAADWTFDTILVDESRLSGEERDKKEVVVVLQHTPGPWKVGDVGGTDYVGDGGEGLYVQQAYGTHDVICHLDWSCHNRIADAKLIAAGPVMLEALKATDEYNKHIENCPRATCEDCDALYDKMLEKVPAAIAAGEWRGRKEARS